MEPHPPSVPLPLHPSKPRCSSYYTSRYRARREERVVQLCPIPEYSTNALKRCEAAARHLIASEEDGTWQRLSGAVTLDSISVHEFAKRCRLLTEYIRCCAQWDCLHEELHTAFVDVWKREAQSRRSLATYAALLDCLVRREADQHESASVAQWAILPFLRVQCAVPGACSCPLAEGALSIAVGMENKPPNVPC